MVDIGVAGLQPAPATTTPHDPPHDVHTAIEKRRWVMLVLLSALNLLSDFICFSLAPIEDFAAERFSGLNAASLILVFFFTNLGACFIEPYLLNRHGLRNTVLGAALLLLLANLLKGGIPFVAANRSAALVYIGFAVAGVAQPLVQVTAVTLVENWFPLKERWFATTVAVSSNQLGIGLAYLLGNMMISNSGDLHNYLHGTTWVTAVLLLATACVFKSQPEHPPSKSAAAKRARPQPQLTVMGHWRAIAVLRSIPGFWLTVQIFCSTATAAGTIATFLPNLMEALGHSSRGSVGALGFSFQLALVLGSVAAGLIVRDLERGATVLLTLTVVSLAVTSVLISCGAFAGFVPLVLIVAAAVGPLLPLSADLGIEVVYPHSENDVLLVCILMASLVSCLIVTLNFILKGVTEVQYAASTYMLTAVTACALMAFVLLFKGKLNRSKFEQFYEGCDGDAAELHAADNGHSFTNECSSNDSDSLEQIQLGSMHSASRATLV